MFEYVPGVGSIPSWNIKYIDDDKAIDFKNKNYNYTGIGLSLMINDVYIELDEGGFIMGVRGYCPRTEWIPRMLIPPVAHPGVLRYVDFNRLTPGVSHSMTSNCRWPVLFDQDLKWLCFSNDQPAIQSIGVSEDVIISLDGRSRLVQLWVRLLNLA
jgi:hypothetical protein